MGMARSDQQWMSDILSGTSNSNRLSGRVYKEGSFWLAELLALYVMTQGKTQDDAYGMVKDLDAHCTGFDGPACSPTCRASVALINSPESWTALPDTSSFATFAFNSKLVARQLTPQASFYAGNTHGSPVPA